MHEIQARQTIEYTVGQVPAHQNGLSGQQVHPGSGHQRQQKPRHHMDGGNQSRSQGASRFIKDQEGQGKATGDAAYGADRGCQSQKGKVSGPKCLFHINHLGHIITWITFQKTVPCFETIPRRSAY